MITTRLMGGIGNQLFQYAAGFALASRLGVGLQLDTSWFRNRDARAYRLNALAITAREATDEDLRRAGIRHPGRFLRALARVGFGRLAEVGGCVNEPGFAYWPGIRALADGVCLSGYWQSERYFEDVAGAIRSEFAFRDPPDPESQRTLDSIRSAEAVAVHVRRGDYAADPRTRSYHGTTALAYYEAAARRMLTCVRDPVFFVFSDDPAWVEHNLRLAAPMVRVAHQGPARDIEDLRLMSACRHAILANSTFGWWGAWLAESKGQRVIAPQRWFQNGPDASDLIPARWERLA